MKELRKCSDFFKILFKSTILGVNTSKAYETTLAPVEHFVRGQFLHEGPTLNTEITLRYPGRTRRLRSSRRLIAMLVILIIVTLH